MPVTLAAESVSVAVIDADHDVWLPAGIPAHAALYCMDAGIWNPGVLGQDGVTTIPA